MSDLTWAIGAWLGDGYCTRDGIGFCGTYEMCTKFSSIMGIHGAISRDTRRDDLYVVRSLVNDKPLWSPPFRMNASTKVIPHFIFNATEEDRWDLVQGLLDTDGTIDHNGRLDWTFKSRSLIDQLSSLLSSLGVWVKVSTKEIPNYGTFYRCWLDAYENLDIYKNGRKQGYTTDSKNIRKTLEIDGVLVSDEIRAHRLNFDFRNKRDIGSQLSRNVKKSNKITLRSIERYKEFYGELPPMLEEIQKEFQKGRVIYVK